MKKKKILVTGGAGFIGSQVNQLLNDRGYETIFFDNLSNSSLQARYPGLFIEGDLGNASQLDLVFSSHSIDAVMHFAAFIDVGESTVHPERYYFNNVMNTLHLLNAMVRHGVDTFIFSSTAAVYGEPQAREIQETHPLFPINPYGRSKLMCEQILGDYESAHGLRFIALRYFNAAGGDAQGRIKNRQVKRTNLIPIILHNLANSRPQVTVNGTDYPTPDGTCLRDYIHIMDLADAHILALESLFQGGPSTIYNLGNGRSHSVLEVIQATEKVTGVSIETIRGPRRPGDPVELLANASRAREELGWTPQFEDLEVIIEHAWKSMSKPLITT